MYENEKLRQIFQSPFSKSTWNSILLEIVKAKDLRIVPEEIDVPEDCTKGFYLGEQDRNDAYRIGLFLYEVRRGNIARKRVGLRNLVRNYINSSGAFDAALVVFTDGTLWRLSFICDIKELATAPKRFTFVFGDPQNRYRTAIERFQILQEKGVTFESLKEAFSVEALSKEFFGQYKEHYLRFCDFIYENANNKKFFGEEFAKWNANAGTQKYIRDYVKNLLGRIVFLQFLQKKGWMGIPENHKTWTGGDTNFLYNLYDKASLAQKNNFLDEILEPLFFDCLNTKREGDVYDTKVAAVGRVKIPYLNGGLFEQKDIDLPKSVFPREMFGDLLDFFTQYNFTIDENDPNDAEIGVDPEMLGKIFENLLEDNKDKGAFYTPKEIVQYMCRESIDAYLRENKNVGKSELGLLKQVKVCDPAIGSGAFPMGILNELYRRRLELGETMRAEIKREIIQKNIYGVDIEQGAVDIARLRFWLALVVDSEKPEPLPNLDYKIMQGNSLLEQYKGEDLSKLIKPKKYYDKDGNQVLFSSAAATQMTFFDDINDIDKEKLSNLVSTYYSSHENKQSLREQIKENVISQLCTTGVNKSIISALEKMKIHANSEFFLWHTWFAEVFADGGFDIVIGNPPYISAPTQIATEHLAHQRELLAKSGEYKTLYQKWDLYIPFMEKGLRLLSKGGSFAMIVPYPLSNQLYGKTFREWVLKNYNVSEIADLNGTKIFENATVSNLILFATATEPKSKTKISHINENKEIKVDFVQEETDLVQDEKTKVWNLTQEKREMNRHADMHVLGDYCYISIGMVLNADEKSEKGAFTKDELISSEKDEIHCKKYIEGKDLEKYKVKRIRYLEYGTERVPDRLRRPTFPELYDRSKLLINALGDLKVAIDDNDNYYCEQQARMAMPWYLLKGVENKSISSSIKKFSKMSRQEMEKLSKTVSLKYLLGIMNSKYASVLLTNIRSGDYHITPEHIRNIPIPKATKEEQAEIIALVDTILLKKKFGEDASAEERKIDIVIYKLYGLSYDEVFIIDPTSITKEEYENYKKKE